MLKHHIQTTIHNALTPVLSQQDSDIAMPQDNIEVTHPDNLQFGDYTTNIAMKLAKQLKQNPMAIAEEIVKHINRDDIIEKAEVVKPGFINIHLTQGQLLKDLSRATENDQSFFHPDIFQKKKVMFEFTDPNPFKEFHIGHLFTNFVGESLSRIYEAAGADVRRANYQGDVGMHVARSIWGMMKKMKEERITIEDLEKKSIHERVNFLGQAYARGATAYKDHDQAKEEMKDINYLVFISAQEHLVETENWNPQVDYSQYLSKTKLPKDQIKELYAKGRTWSLEYFELIYKRLGTKFDYYYFESFVGEYGVQIVNEYLKKGIFEESNGAVVFPGEKHGLHTRVFINSLGLPTYETKELGLAPTKYKDFPYDLAVIVTGNEIDQYFRVLIAALKETNPDLGNKTKHLSHGMVKLPSGKMSSRTGKVITGEWLLDETKQIIQKVMKDSEKAANDDIEQISDILAVAAVKYSFLKVALGKDIIFDFNESVSFEGNSGPYLVYTYVRTQSVIRKAYTVGTYGHTSLPTSYKPNPEESLLLRTLYQYPEVVAAAANQFAPHHIATYLYSVAHLYNTFYQKHPILKGSNESQQFRLALTNAVAHVLQNGLHLLGIRTVEKM
jgi:arginyl-tRNA synthetase